MTTPTTSLVKYFTSKVAVPDLRTEILTTPATKERILEIVRLDGCTTIFSTPTKYMIGSFLNSQKESISKAEFKALLVFLHNMPGRTERKYRALAKKVDDLMKDHVGDAKFQNDLLNRNITEIDVIYKKTFPKDSDQTSETSPIIEPLTLEEIVKLADPDKIRLEFEKRIKKAATLTTKRIKDLKASHKVDLKIKTDEIKRLSKALDEKKTKEISVEPSIPSVLELVDKDQPIPAFLQVEQARQQAKNSLA